MGKYTYTCFMELLECRQGCPGINFWFPDWNNFLSSDIYLPNDAAMVLYIRQTLLMRCKFFEKMGYKFPRPRNYSDRYLAPNVTIQTMTVDTESE